MTVAYPGWTSHLNAQTGPLSRVVFTARCPVCGDDATWLAVRDVRSAEGAYSGPERGTVFESIDCATCDPPPVPEVPPRRRPRRHIPLTRKATP